MNSKLVIGVTAFLFLVVFDIYVYQTKEENSKLRLKKCFPTGEMFPYKDESGNIVYDSVYHTITDFKLTDQNGNEITNQSLKGKIYVANFFFATCTSICPRMTNYMHVLQEDFENEDLIVFLSHTVDPETDSVPSLKKYARQNKINGNKWHLLTGKRSELYELSKLSYYLGVANDSPDNFEHSEKFVLVDSHRIIRGYYDGTDSFEVVKLEKDIKILLIELKKETLNI